MSVKPTPARPQPHDLKIIGGTVSMKHALEKLGIKTHHMIEVIGKPDQMRSWQKASQESLSPAEWDDLLRPYGACVDAPSSAHYKVLADIYPDAKVLITTRDDASWFKSVHNSILKSIPKPLDGMLLYIFDPSCRPWANFIRAWLNDPNSYFHSGKPKPDSLSTYVRDVQAFFAERGEADRVFVYDLNKATEWKGICTWLDLPVPSEPWPFENASEAGKTAVAADGTVRTATTTFANLNKNSDAVKARQAKVWTIKRNLLLGTAGVVGAAAVASTYWSRLAKRV